MSNENSDDITLRVVAWVLNLIEQDVPLSTIRFAVERSHDGWDLCMLLDLIEHMHDEGGDECR